MTSWAALRASYWFVPALMTAASAILSMMTTWADKQTTGNVLEITGGFFAGGPEDARQLFNTLAGSMITVAGVTFSVTIVVLTLASQQFGPRLLHNFMRDMGTQVVLGTFVSTFVYCLLVLRTVRAGDESEFIPQVSATVAIALALASLGVLIYFIHHVASSIRVTSVTTRISNELCRTMNEYFPANLGDNPAVAAEQETARHQMEAMVANNHSHQVQAAQNGYLQAIDTDELLTLAERHNLVIRLDRSPGDFVVECGKLATVWPGGMVNKEIEDSLRETMVFGTERTSVQDMEFSVMQLVETAVRALSPGINDPQTAVLCIDQLTVALCRLAHKEIPSPYRHSSTGSLRIIIKPMHMTDFVRASFDQIRQYGRASVPVTKRLLSSVAVIADQLQRQEDHAELFRQVKIIQAAIPGAVPDDQDRKELLDLCAKALRDLSPSLPSK
jgi:uncharacterized membrane protein